ncbi:MAG: ABC transporter substrate-binding protein [Lachnospiraceae bacterium]|jgi:ABC-type transport system substrate-binding protein
MTEQQENKRMKEIGERFRKLSKKQWAAALVILAAVVFLVVFLMYQSSEELVQVKKGNASAVQKEGERKETLIVAADAMTGEVNPVFAQTDQDMQISDLVFEPLMQQESDGSYTAVLAKKVDISEDGKEFTIHLKNNIKFSDGSEMTADDVYASLAAAAFMHGTEPGSGYQNLEGMTPELYTAENYDMPGIQVVDENTVKLLFATPSPENLQVLETRVQKRDIVDLTSDHPFAQIDDFRSKGIGTGPYVLLDQPNSSRTFLQVNENSRAKAKDIKKIQFLHVNYYDTLAAMENSEIDVIYYNSRTAAFKEIYDVESFTVYEKPGNVIDFIGFNNKSIYGSNTEIRQAIAAAFNKEAFFENEAVASIAEKTDFCIPGGSKKGGISYDQEKAKEKVASAAKTLGAEEILLRLPVREDDEWQNMAADQLKTDLDAVGIQLEISKLSEDDYMKTLFSDGTYDLYFSSMQIEPTVTSLEQLMSDRDTLSTGIQTEQLETALDKFRSSYTFADYKQNLEKMNQAMAEDLPIIPFAREKGFFSISADLSGYDMRPGGVWMENVNKIKVK